MRPLAEEKKREREKGWEGRDPQPQHGPFSNLVTSRLRNRGHHQRGNTLLLGAHRDLGRDAILGAVGHPDVGHDPAAADGLSEELERVCGLVDGGVGALEGLQREGLGQLLGRLCEGLLVIPNDVVFFLGGGGIVHEGSERTCYALHATQL